MLKRVQRPAFLARVRRRGRELMQALAALAARRPAIAQARGLGLLCAIELAPEARFDSAALVRAARDQRLLLVRGGERAVRLLPPLNVTADELLDAVSRIDRAIGNLERSAS